MSKDYKVTRGEILGKPRFRANLINATLFLMLTVFARTLAAGECFCLEDEDKNFRHSCQTQRQGIRTVIHCEDDAGNPYKLDELAGWTRLNAGKGRCNPCRQGKGSSRGDPIRTGEADRQTSEGSADADSQ